MSKNCSGNNSLTSFFTRNVAGVVLFTMVLPCTTVKSTAPKHHGTLRYHGTLPWYSGTTVKSSTAPKYHGTIVCLDYAETLLVQRTLFHCTTAASTSATKVKLPLMKKYHVVRYKKYRGILGRYFLPWYYHVPW